MTLNLGGGAQGLPFFNFSRVPFPSLNLSTTERAEGCLPAGTWEQYWTAEHSFPEGKSDGEGRAMKKQ